MGPGSRENEEEPASRQNGRKRCVSLQLGCGHAALVLEGKLTALAFSPFTGKKNQQISDNPRPNKRSRRNDDGVASLTSANAAPLGGSSNNNNNGNNPQKKNKGDRFADFLAVMNPAKSVQAESSSMNEDVQALLAPAAAAGEGTKKDQKAKKNKKGGDEAAPAAAEPPAESDGAAQDEELTDAEYLARRMKRKLSEVDDDDEDGVLQEEADDGEAADAPEFEQDAEDGGKVRSIRGKMSGCTAALTDFISSPLISAPAIANKTD